MGSHTSNSIQPLNDELTRIEIVNRFLVGQSTKEIAKELELAEPMVKYYLSEDSSQDYLAKSASNKEIQLHIKRIDRAGDMMDKLLDRIEGFIDNDEYDITQWRDSHVSLIKDVLLNKLPTTISKAIGTAININLGGTTSATSIQSNPFSDTIKGMDPEQVLLFWSVLEKITEHIKAGRLGLIQQLVKELDNIKNAE